MVRTARLPADMVARDLDEESNTTEEMRQEAEKMQKERDRVKVRQIFLYLFLNLLLKVIIITSIKNKHLFKFYIKTRCCTSFSIHFFFQHF